MNYAEYWAAVFGPFVSAEQIVLRHDLKIDRNRSPRRNRLDLRDWVTRQEAEAINQGASLSDIDVAHEKATDALLSVMIDQLV